MSINRRRSVPPPSMAGLPARWRTGQGHRPRAPILNPYGEFIDPVTGEVMNPEVADNPAIHQAFLFKTSIFSFAGITTALAVRVLPANAARAYLLIQNYTGNTMAIGFGVAPSATSGLRLGSNGVYEQIGGGKTSYGTGAFVSLEDVYLIGVGGAVDGIVIEGLYLGGGP